MTYRLVTTRCISHANIRKRSRCLIQPPFQPSRNGLRSYSITTNNVTTPNQSRPRSPAFYTPPIRCDGGSVLSAACKKGQESHQTPRSAAHKLPVCLCNSCVCADVESTKLSKCRQCVSRQNASSGFLKSMPSALLIHVVENTEVSPRQRFGTGRAFSCLNGETKPKCTEQRQT
jgi:hypothetical protein